MPREPHLAPSGFVFLCLLGPLHESRLYAPVFFTRLRRGYNSPVSHLQEVHVAHRGGRGACCGDCLNLPDGAFGT